METTKIIALIAIVVAVSGCSNLPGSNTSTPTEQKQVAGKGLEVTSLRASDNTLSPGQRATVILNLKNYHTEEISLINNTLINTGLLEVSNKRCSPSQIRKAQQDIKPEMQCKWDVRVPSSVDLDVDT